MGYLYLYLIYSCVTHEPANWLQTEHGYNADSGYDTIRYEMLF